MSCICISSAASSVSIPSASAGCSSEKTVEAVAETFMKKKIKTKKSKKRGTQARANHEARKREQRSIARQNSSSSSSSSSKTTSNEYISGSYAACGNQLVQDVCSIYELVDRSEYSYGSGRLNRSGSFSEVNSGPVWDNAEDEYLNTMGEQTKVTSNHWVVFPGEVKELLQGQELTNKATTRVASIESILKFNESPQKGEVPQVDKFIDDSSQKSFSMQAGILDKEVEAIGSDGAFDTFAEIGMVEEIIMGSNIIEDTTIEDTTAEDTIIEDTVIVKDIKHNRTTTEVPSRVATERFMDEFTGATEFETVSKLLASNTSHTITKGIRVEADKPIMPVEHRTVGGIIKEVAFEKPKIPIDKTRVLVPESEKTEEIVTVQIIQKYNERIRVLEAEVSKKDSEIKDLEQRMKVQKNENLGGVKGAVEELVKGNNFKIEVATETLGTQTEVFEAIGSSQGAYTKKVVCNEEGEAENAVKRESETAKQLETLTENLHHIQEQYASRVANFEAEKMELQMTIDRIANKNFFLQVKVNADNELLKNSYRIVRDLKDRFKFLARGSEVIGGGIVRIPLSTLSMVNTSIKELKQLMQTNENIEYEQALVRKGRSDAIDAALLRIDKEQIAKGFALWESKCQDLDARVSILTAHINTSKTPPANLVVNVTKEGNNLNMVTKTDHKKYGNKLKGKGKKGRPATTVDTKAFTGGIPDGGDFEDGIRKLFRRESPKFEGLRVE